MKIKKGRVVTVFHVRTVEGLSLRHNVRIILTGPTLSALCPYKFTSCTVDLTDFCCMLSICVLFDKRKKELYFFVSVNKSGLLSVHHVTEIIYTFF